MPKERKEGSLGQVSMSEWRGISSLVRSRHALNKGSPDDSRVYMLFLFAKASSKGAVALNARASSLPQARSSVSSSTVLHLMLHGAGWALQKTKNLNKNFR